MSDKRPVLAITMGDPAGVGPEIIVKAMARAPMRALARLLVIGDAGVIARAGKMIGSAIAVRPIERVADARFEPGTIDVYDLKNINPATFQLGIVSAEAGNAAFEAIRAAFGLAQSSAIHGTVTAPIHKEALIKAGHHFPGHTEIFAHFTGAADVTMMLAAGDFRVVHVSTHVSLRKACDAVTFDRVLKVIELGHAACVRLGIANPRIGVAGLNPHASDGGLFGTEEAEVIRPAIEAARTKGINAEGPQPADTMFPKAIGGAYDICVAMYHDQGHTPVKCQGFKYNAESRTWEDVRGINVSLGLPIIRTSVDHGTAFDQAGRGTASDASLADAVEYAAKLANMPA